MHQAHKAVIYIFHTVTLLSPRLFHPDAVLPLGATGQTRSAGPGAALSLSEVALGATGAVLMGPGAVLALQWVLPWEGGEVYPDNSDPGPDLSDFRSDLLLMH